MTLFLELGRRKRFLEKCQLRGMWASLEGSFSAERLTLGEKLQQELEATHDSGQWVLHPRVER